MPGRITNFGKRVPPGNLIGDQQPQSGFEADALFSRKRDAIGFGGFVGISSGEAKRTDLALPYRSLSEASGIFLVRHLALPLAVGCRVGAIRIEERVAAAQ